MRNAIECGNGLIITTDNSGGIGEKPADIVHASDRVTAYFAARVTLLEQWAAQAQPFTVLIHNFSGSGSWTNYVAGVTDLFNDAGLAIPPISGSTETNMPLLQSAMAVTMIGNQTVATCDENEVWFTVGKPLVGQEVLDGMDEIAPIGLLREAMENGIAQQIWPVGSKGILAEVRAMTGNQTIAVTTVLDTMKSAGPATVVLIAIPVEKVNEAKVHFGLHLHELHIFN